MSFAAFACPTSTGVFTGRRTSEFVCSRRSATLTPTELVGRVRVPARWKAVTQPINTTLLSPVSIPYNATDAADQKSTYVKKSASQDGPNLNWNPDTKFDPVLHKNQFSGHVNYHMDVVFDDSTPSTLEYEGVTYYLKQLHLHHPAEHTLGSRNRSEFAMEVHFVHNTTPGHDNSGKFCVFGSLLVGGSDNSEFNEILDGIGEELPVPDPEGKDVFDSQGEFSRTKQAIPIDCTKLIQPVFNNPTNWIGYVGSLTTMTTDESGNASFLPGEVQWFVSKDVAQADQAKVQQLINTMGIGSAQTLSDNGGYTFNSFELP